MGPGILYTSEGILLVGALLLFSSILVSKIGGRFGLPSLLLFLFVGMFFGSDGLGIQFSDPNSAQFIGMMALSIILFSGGMDTKFSQIKPIFKQGLALSTFGVLITTAVTGVCIYYLSQWISPGTQHISYAESFLLAAVMASTDSASVFSILRSKNIRLKQQLGPLLEFESGSNDPMGYMLTIFIISYIQIGGMNLAEASLMLGAGLIIGALAGYLIGKFAVYVTNRININNKSLYPILLLSITFFTFAATTLCSGNGYLAVYIAGLVVGNAGLKHKESTATFFDGFSWLWQIVMFLTLGLLVNPHELKDAAPLGLAISVGMILVARPVSVFLSLLPFRNISFKGKLFVSWVGLRGAVPIIFATYPMIAGINNANLFFNIVFFMTIVSLLVQGMTIAPLAKRLGLIEDSDKKTQIPFGKHNRLVGKNGFMPPSMNERVD